MRRTLRFLTAALLLALATTPAVAEVNLTVDVGVG